LWDVPAYSKINYQNSNPPTSTEEIIFNEAHHKTLTQRQKDRQTGSEETMVRQKRGGKMINAWRIAARK
jgi:hypothetical protein